MHNVNHVHLPISVGESDWEFRFTKSAGKSGTLNSLAELRGVSVPAGSGGGGKVSEKCTKKK
jgi:hypothetical protein